MPETLDKYIERAKSVLDANWTGFYTMPAPGLYPHQWNRDSGYRHGL